ncbi:MAG: M56 family metallopeptidase [Defluviitaleaceae bacterium]|nr:M56 family metallopeptidase [Defluviitaleaceae bacterium]
MNDLLLTVLSLSLSGSIIIAILFLCKPLYKKRLSKKWHYYIWLVVITRMLVPLSFEINIVGGIFSGFSQPGTLENELNSAMLGGGEAQIITNTPNTQNTNFDLQTATPETQTSATYSQNNIFSMLISYAWLIWIVVAAILFIRKLTIYQGFVNYIKAGRVELDSIDDLERFGRLMRQLKIKKMVGIYTNSLISSPLLIGFFKPYIALPTTNISEADFENTILHELTHYKRGDMFYKWLVQLTICLHWFNPLAYLMGREINNACELSCDEAVIKNLDDDGIKAYGNTLLNALGFGGKYKNALSSITLSDNKKILGERLNMIKNFKKKPKSAALCAVLLAIVLGMGAGIAGVYGMTNPMPVENNAPPMADGGGEFGIGTTDNTGAESNTPLIIDDDKPFIGVSLSFDIPYIQPAESLQIGRITFGPGIIYNYYFSSESGNFMVGLRRTPNDGSWMGSGWFNLASNRQGQWQFDEEATVYVYIISGSGNPEFGAVANITGHIFREDEQITFQAEQVTLNEAVIMAMDYAEKRNLEWHGNMQETFSVSDRHIHVVTLMNWTGQILHFAAIDANTGDIVSFETSEIGVPFNVLGGLELFIQNLSTMWS